MDGRAYQLQQAGVTQEADSNSEVEWPGVISFRPNLVTATRSILSISDLISHCDSLRSHQRCSYAYRLEGRFSQLLIGSWTSRAASTVLGYREHPAAYEFDSMQGSILGFWAPEHAESARRRPYLSRVWRGFAGS